MTRGYFPGRVIPPVNSLGLGTALTDMLNYVRPIASKMVQKKANKLRSRCVTHSIPKRKHLRRTLSIPNPFHQCMLSDEIATNWLELEEFCSKSPFSLSAPILDSTRSIDRKTPLNIQPQFRAHRSVGRRYLLKTDIARFYPSIYTHSIPWALHGKPAARKDTQYQLLGNRLDLWTRETQDKQTGRIPIGPDSSFLIGEIVGTALDLELKDRLPALRGTRNIDDYYLYFDSVSDAETGLAALHSIARQFELEINDPKTEIVQLPDILEPSWKSELRNIVIRKTPQPQATDLLNLFDRAFEHSKNFPTDNVLTYAARQVLSSDIFEENWELCEALLLKAAIAEPTMMSVLELIYDNYASYHTSNDALASALYSICYYHAPLQQGNEVSWALWLARKLNVPIPKSVADAVAKLDDDVVALVALDLLEQGNFDTDQLELWYGHMAGSSLYEDHWLLAYEAHEHGWQPTTVKKDYVAADPFFSILQTHGVRFYGDGLAATTSYMEYGEEEIEGIDPDDYDPEEPEEEVDEIGL
ncbi:RNA-directed DNA polymerase [Alloacidobacterium dinghuense]|uniref:RNA-directed DNA polymerase n=1 Tax=Alloacidobacterium dinghuense TaxID=2763107 RepID=A0A7G8BF92_9BACT|nr:RNA-directed DNA polymerase [Alloacidobacterium dinghuense]QNI31212.1 RNA-directed DNA polymerase [Alloacidobacterium dinghuense]